MRKQDEQASEKGSARGSMDLANEVPLQVPSSNLKTMIEYDFMQNRSNAMPINVDEDEPLGGSEPPKEDRALPSQSANELPIHFSTDEPPGAVCLHKVKRHQSPLGMDRLFQVYH